MTPAQVERAGARPAIEEKLDPWGATPREVRLDHRLEGPALQMFSLDLGVEHHPEPVRRQAHPEVDVFDARVREALFVEAACGLEGISTDGAETGPERRSRAGTELVNVVVKQVPEVGDSSVAFGLGVVGAEDGYQARVGLERPPKAPEGVRMNLDVGVEEDEHLRLRTTGSFVAPGGRPESARFVHNDDLFWGVLGTKDRL